MRFLSNFERDQYESQKVYVQDFQRRNRKDPRSSSSSTMLFLSDVCLGRTITGEDTRSHRYAIGWELFLSQFWSWRALTNMMTFHNDCHSYFSSGYPSLIDWYIIPSFNKVIDNLILQDVGTSSSIQISFIGDSVSYSARGALTTIERTIHAIRVKERIVRHGDSWIWDDGTSVTKAWSFRSVEWRERGFQLTFFFFRSPWSDCDVVSCSCPVCDSDRGKFIWRCVLDTEEIRRRRRTRLWFL